MKIAAALGALTLGAVIYVPVSAVAAAPASAEVRCSNSWGTQPTNSGELPGPSPLTGADVGRHECYDRVVFSVLGPPVGYRVRYVSQVPAEGTGFPLPVAGGAKLHVTLLAPAYDENGHSTYPYDTNDQVANVAGFRTLRDVVFGGSFEGYTTFGVGTRARLPFRVFTLPTGGGVSTRIVLDVAHTLTRGDFTGDNVADAAVFRPTTGTWWVRGLAPVRWGLAGDVPLSGDFTGDGRADYAVFRPSTGTWWVRGVATVPWGLAGDVPVSGDFTGDGRADIAVFRPSTGTWFVRGVATVPWGRTGDVPVAADYTGDGRADLAVFRPSTGTWWVRGVATVPWGRAGDVPVAVDYTGDGRADIAVFRPTTGTWWIRGQAMTSWGTGIDIPTPADYTGDGRADIAVFRPPTGTWWVRGVSTFRFGMPGDIPVR